MPAHFQVLLRAQLGQDLQYVFWGLLTLLHKHESG